jgi:MSHA biogenesis protein MshP
MMCREQQGGFALPTAIFLLVVLWLLGAFIASISAIQQSAFTLDTRGVAAYDAAKAGIEWGAYQVLDPENTLNPSTCDPVVLAECPGAGGTTALTGLAGSLAPYTVTVQCTKSDASEGHRRLRVYTLTATACSEPTAGACPGATPSAQYVERRVTATLVKCKDRTASAPRCACGG